MFETSREEMNYRIQQGRQSVRELIAPLGPTPEAQAMRSAFARVFDSLQEVADRAATRD